MPREHEHIEDIGIRSNGRRPRMDSGATPAMVDFDRADIAEHLGWVFRGQRGYFAVGLLDRRTAKMTERVYTSVGAMQRGVTAAARNDEGAIEVFYCPLPLSTADRAKGNSASRWLVWVDIDKPLSDALRDTLKRWGFRLVASGTPGRLHAYARLDRGVTLDEHRAIQEALAKQFNGDPALVSDNALLRVPDTTNYKNHPNVKADKRNDQPYPVRILVRGKRQVDTAWLMKQLSIDLTKPVATTRVITGEWNRVPVPLRLPDIIRQYMFTEEEDVEDRSEASYAAICACAEATARDGSRLLTLDQIHAVLENYGPGVAKYNGRWHKHINEVYAKWQSKGVQAVEPWTGIEGFWERRPVLTHISRYAKAHRLGPWGLLGCVLVRVVTSIPPHVKLPDDGSLNLYLGLVGLPGAGKGRTINHAAKVVELGKILPEPVSIGTGQGIPHLFKRRLKDGSIETHSVSALFVTPEIDDYVSLTKGEGSNLDPTLRSAWVGESIGGSYADPTKRLPVPAHSYRLCWIMGIQPDHAQPLLARVTGGTPQRFLWLPVYDGDMPDVRPPSPGVWDASQDIVGPDEMGVPDSIMAAIDADQVARDRKVAKKQPEDPFEAQGRFGRWKVAAAFALLDRRTAVSEDDWNLAGVVYEVSKRVRGDIQQRGEELADKMAAIRGVQEAKKQQAMTDQLRRTSVSKCMDAVVRKLTTLGDWMAAGKLRVAIGGSRYSKEDFAEALARLLKAGKVEKRDTEYNGQRGTSWRIKS